MGFIINPYQVQPSGPSYGTLTTAWITATGETDTTILSALNTLESDLSTYGLTSKIKALYPFVGGTSTKHSYNFMDTSAFQLTFSGGWTHASTGALPNGTNAYANTGLTPSTSLTKFSEHFSLYSRTNNKRDALHGARAGGYKASALYIRSTDAPDGTFQYWSYCWVCSSINVNNTDSRGLFLATNTSATNRKAYRNGSVIGTNTYDMTAQDQTDISMFIGAENNSGTAQNYDNKELALASLGYGFTDAESANFYTAVQAFQTTLGRSIGTQTVSDSDAQAFVTAANIQDQVQANAINDLVIGMKADGLWTKMKAIYPFVGGTATTHKWNLKDPQDTDAAFRLVFNGGITHNSNGVTGNGSNGYYDTKLNPSTEYSLSTGGSGFVYIRNNTDSNVDFGAFQSGVNYRFYAAARSGNQFLGAGLSGNYYSASNTDSTGFYGITRLPNDNTGFYNILNTTNAFYSDAYQEPNSVIAGLAFNIDSGTVQYFSDHNHSFASFGTGLTTTEAQNLRSRVLTFNSTLGR